MIVHAIKLLGIQLRIVGGWREQLRCTRFKKLLIVLEWVAPLRWAYKTLRLQLLVVKLDGIVHEWDLFMDKLWPLLWGRAFLIHLGWLPTNRSEWSKSFLQCLHLDLQFLILFLRFVATVLRLLLRHRLIDRGSPSVVNMRRNVLQLCLR